MTGLRTLVIGPNWTPNEEQRELCKLWAKCIDRVAPNCDVLVIDCDSPFRPEVFLKWLDYTTYAYDHEFPMRRVFDFGDNVGHLFSGGKDGWGRAICKGVEIAIAAQYDYLAVIETDTLFSRPITTIIEKMDRAGVKVACPLNITWQTISTSTMFFNVNYLKDINFVDQYDWPNRRKEGNESLPERVCEHIFQDELFILPFRGIVNDRHQVTRANLKEAFPFGCDWITHCKDFGVYEEFMRLNGVSG